MSVHHSADLAGHVPFWACTKQVHVALVLTVPLEAGAVLSPRTPDAPVVKTVAVSVAVMMGFSSAGKAGAVVDVAQQGKKAAVITGRR